jgi:hypothetical protein
MKNNTKAILSGFSLGATIVFFLRFFCRIYGAMTRRLVFIGPDHLSEIPWLQDSFCAIAAGIVFGICFYELERVETGKGKEVHIPRIKFKNFGIAILFFTMLFLGVMLLFVIREYYVYASEISYMFRKTFWQYCYTQIPWYEILATSLIFGVILALGFSKTKKE